MKTFTNAFKLSISLTLLAVATPLLWNCIDFSNDYTRFWLLESNSSNQRLLLPFTFTSERYYYYRWTEEDTTYRKENIAAWKTMLGDKIKDNDVWAILYDVTPDDFANKNFAKKNSFMASLNKSNHALHLQYLSFSKKCEAIFNGAMTGDEFKSRATALIPEGNTILQATANNPDLCRRAAYQLIKLYRVDNNTEKIKALFGQYFNDNTKKDWLSAAAIFQIACEETDPVQSNIKYARAWDAGFYNPIWVWHGMYEDKLEASISAATTGRDKATLTIIPATRKPEPALTDIQKAYQFDPSVPHLSKLMAREVNKLENWLLSPVIYGAQNRVEMPSSYENPPKLDADALLQKDMEHLHQCRAFAQQVIQEKKRDDMAFWYLVAAHLAYLDRDFKGTMELAQTGSQITNTPMNQKIQLQLINVLAEIGGEGQISTVTEDKIPGVFQSIRDNASTFDAPVELEEKLATLLSDQFIKKQERAKGALLLGKTSPYYEGLGYMSAGVLFEKLLEIGTPADFDQAIQIVEHPKTDFERWFANEPYRYHANFEYDEQTGKEKLLDKQPKGWETDKLRECKAMYYMRKDQPDSALLAIKDVPDTYWQWRANIADYGEILFRNNPFSVGVTVAGVPLSQANNNSAFNKRTFLEQLIALKNDKSTDKQQENYLLLGNAYYNMTYHGNDWWLMIESGWSSNLPSMGNEIGSIPENGNPYLPLLPWTALGLLGIAVGFSVRKRGRWIVFLILGVGLLPFSCKKPTVEQKVAATSSLAYYDAYYRCSLAKSWYEKALKMNPDNDLGIAAAFMAGTCETHIQYMDFLRTRKDPNEEFKSTKNALLEGIKGKDFTSPLSCAELGECLK
jgi:hypothetical protein